MKYMISLLMVLAVSGCSFEVVEPATKGKILTTAGYDPDILEPGKYTLWGRDKLITLQTNTNTYKESVNVVLADKLTLRADVRFRGRVAGTEKTLNMMFNDISAGEDKEKLFATLPVLAVFILCRWEWMV